MDETLSTVEVEVGPLTFDVVDRGPRDAPAVLLLHGFPQSSHSWRLVLPHLADYRVIVPDQRGYSPGARPDGIEAYRGPELTADALGILDALGLERAHVVGHDWGAAVAWQVAARYPDRVRTLSAVSVPHPVAFVRALRSDPEQREASRYMRDLATEGYAEVLVADDGARLRTLFGPTPPDVDLDHALERARQPGALQSWLWWYAAQRSEDVADTPDVVVPTLHVWSDGDHALRRAGAELSAEHVTGPYRLEVLHGVSHWIPEEAPDALGALLVAHLGRVTG